MGRRAGLFIIGVAALLAILMFERQLILDQNDVRIYFEIGRNAIADQRTFASEYPPFMTALFGLLAGDDKELFVTLWSVLLLACAGGIGLYGMVRLKDDFAAAFPLLMALSVMLLGSTIMVGRFDILVCMAMFLAWRTHAKGQATEGGFWLAIATAIKLVPVLLLPLWLIVAPRAWRRTAAGFVAGGVAALACTLIVLGPTGLRSNLEYMFTYHAERGLQVESFAAGAFVTGKKILGERALISFHHGALHVNDAPTWLPPVLSAVALVGTAALMVLAWRRRVGRGELGLYCIALLLWNLAASPVLSPQYLVWVVPLFLAWCMEEWPVRRPGQPVLYIIICIGVLLLATATQWVFPQHYDEYLGMNKDALWILNIRNVLIPFLAGMLLLIRTGTASPQYRKARP